jgi:hypothetical protein
MLDYFDHTENPGLIPQQQETGMEFRKKVRIGAH